MQRREAVRLLGAIAAVPFIPRSAAAAVELGERLHRQLGIQPTFRTLDAEQRALVAAIADAIIPRTDTPGASDVGVPGFIDLILTEWASDAERRAFLSGLADIEARTRTSGAARFVDLPADRRGTLLSALDGERRVREGAGLAFERIKALTIYGYFTSEVVQRDVLRTQMIFPGYEPCAPAP